MKFLLIIICLFVSTFSYAGGRGGTNKTFDPNSYGGGWTCFRSLASGTCGSGTFTQYLDAICDGSTSDNTALASWITYAHGLGTALAKLYIPSGSSCTFSGNTSFALDVSINCAGFGASSNTVVQNLLVWAYGATVNSAWFGGRAFYSVQNPNGVQTGCSGAPTNTSPLINTVSVGATSVTLSTAGEISNFTVGDWIVVTALSNTLIGNYPPSHTYQEHALITAINSATLTLDRPLQNSYLSTYPNLGGTSPFQGGPATIYLLEKGYNTIARYMGLSVSSIAQSNIIGRSVVLQDVTWTNAAGSGPNPTQSEAIWLIGARYPTSEIDKEIGTLAIINSSAGNTVIQSSSVNTHLVQGSTFSGTITGTTANTQITNSKISALRAGPTCCGRANNLILNGVTVTTTPVIFHFSAMSDYSFSAGTLTISKAATEWTNGKGPGLWVPGTKYYMGDLNGQDNCVPANTFTVSDIIDAGANVQIVTDIVSIPVTNICNSNVRPPSTFAAYQSMALTQKFSGPGNLLSNPEMLPP